ncbi:MAG: NUDIX hydrolase [Anaerolineae bacterium]|nr:MAG: NUDIX hydrolase [Anaerolineae bacterium]
MVIINLVASCSLNVHVVIFSLCEDTLRVLLAPEEQTLWQLPGQPLQQSETLESCALRAFQEQTSRREVYLEQLYTYSNLLHHTQKQLVSVVYFALIPANARREPSAELRWFSVNQLPSLKDNHFEIIAYALRRLRYKLEYSAVGFELLPEEFTLSELQHTYEVILGEKLDKRNFRRRILQAGIIEETKHRRTKGEGRPARLYRYRPDAVAEVKARRLFP